MGVVLISFQNLCSNAKKYATDIGLCNRHVNVVGLCTFLAKLSNNPMHQCDSTRRLICLLIALNSNFLVKQQHYKSQARFCRFLLAPFNGKISIGQLPWGMVQDPITNKLGKFVSRHSLQRQAPKVPCKLRTIVDNNLRSMGSKSCAQKNHVIFHSKWTINVKIWNLDFVKLHLT
ncbi:hypothetical protein T10_5781 [Trichinella papuae]|uniref:Uncharacterized protein n=1 Tax=Trichinella papuae TaxID=268474 RepID=A0A0V1MMS0_9BILA|nr:hypothetical protein T10_5781 [Trichinella papuae]